MLLNGFIQVSTKEKSSIEVSNDNKNT